MHLPLLLVAAAGAVRRERPLLGCSGQPGTALLTLRDGLISGL